MANPALKNGYFSLANELAEQFALKNIPGNEMRILWVVLRKTWGWKKDWDQIAFSQFKEATGMKNGNVSRALKAVVAKRLLIESQNGYSINQNYEEWIVAKRLPGEKYKKYVWPKECSVCGFKKALEKHHIKPRHAGGDDSYENQILICANCHSLADRGDITAAELLQRKREISSQKAPKSSQKASKSVAKRRVTKEINTLSKERGEDGALAPTPREITTAFFKGVLDLVTDKESKTVEAQNVQEFLREVSQMNNVPKPVIWKEVRNFCQYWTESNQSGTRERWEMQKTFEVKLRLGTWFRREGHGTFSAAGSASKGREIISSTAN